MIKLRSAPKTAIDTKSIDSVHVKQIEAKL